MSPLIEIQGQHIKAEEIQRVEKKYNLKGREIHPFIWIEFNNKLVQTFSYPNEVRMLKDYKKITQAIDKLNPIEVW